MEQFFARIDELADKWGSRIKYPMFAGARRKDLARFRPEVTAEAPRERLRLEAGIDTLFGPEVEAARAAMRKRVVGSTGSFGGLVADALRLQGDPDPVQKLRWSLIEEVLEQLFVRLEARLDPADEEFRGGVYLAVEQLLLRVFETFKAFVDQSRATVAELRHPRAADLVAFTDLEIAHTNAFLAAVENKLIELPLTPAIVALAQLRLRRPDLPTARDSKLYAEVSAGLGPGRTLGSWSADRRPIAGLPGDVRTRIVNAVREDVEPVRSLYYLQITLFRYLKGLAQFRRQAG